MITSIELQRPSSGHCLFKDYAIPAQCLPHKTGKTKALDSQYSGCVLPEYNSISPEERKSHLS